MLKYLKLGAATVWLLSAVELILSVDEYRKEHSHTLCKTSA